jgi:hypothetical protein
VRSEWVEDVEVASHAASAQWLTAALDEPWRDEVVRVGAVVPSGFDAYLRVDHASTDDGDAHEGGMPRTVAQRVAAVLASATTTPGLCWMAVWKGWGDMPETPAVIHLPGRDYVLLSGAVDAVAAPLWSSDGDTWHYQSPSLWWPDDRAWCVATEVDFTWTYVAGRESVVDSLRRDRSLMTMGVGLEDNANA